MKKFLSNRWFTLSMGVLAIVLLLGASGQVGLNQNFDLSASKSTKAYAASQVDTVLWSREASVSAAAFAVHWKDTMLITNAIVRRIVDGIYQPVLAGDTLTPYNSLASPAGAGVADKGSAVTATITLNPLADQYAIVVTYGATQGFTSPTAIYEVIKQYSRR